MALSAGENASNLKKKDVVCCGRELMERVRVPHFVPSERGRRVARLLPPFIFAKQSTPSSAYTSRRVSYLKVVRRRFLTTEVPPRPFRVSFAGTLADDGHMFIRAHASKEGPSLRSVFCLSKPRNADRSSLSRRAIELNLFGDRQPHTLQ